MFDFLKRAGQAEPVAMPETKTSATGRVIAWAGSGRVAWSPRDAVSLAKAGFQGNPIGFRAVRLIAEAAAALPVLCQDAERRFDQHPLLALLARPNGGQGRAELMEAARSQLRRYAGDARVREHLGPAHLHALVLLYSGWELVQREALDLADGAPAVT